MRAAVGRRARSPLFVCDPRNDVRITLHSTSEGLAVAAAPEGVKITLE